MRSTSRRGELLTNIVEHTRASTVHVTAEVDEGRARMVAVRQRVRRPESIERRVAGGDIGLVLRRVLLEGRGGRLTVVPHLVGRTVAIAEVPVGEL